MRLVTDGSLPQSRVRRIVLVGIVGVTAALTRQLDGARSRSRPAPDDCIGAAEVRRAVGS